MQTSPGKFWARPSTRLGWWAVGLAITSFLLGFLWLFLPGGALLGFVCGFIGGILALIAIIRHHERSWLVFLSILPIFNVFIFMLGELVIPH